MDWHSVQDDKRESRTVVSQSGRAGGQLLLLPLLMAASHASAACMPISAAAAAAACGPSKRVAATDSTDSAPAAPNAAASIQGSTKGKMCPRLWCVWRGVMGSAQVVHKRVGGLESIIRCWRRGAWWHSVGERALPVPIAELPACRDTTTDALHLLVCAVRGAPGWPLKPFIERVAGCWWVLMSPAGRAAAARERDTTPDTKKPYPSMSYTAGPSGQPTPTLYPPKHRGEGASGGVGGGVGRRRRGPGRQQHTNRSIDHHHHHHYC